jgi:hypothetical protein
VNNSQSVPPVYGQDVPPINGQNVPPSTSPHPPTILPAKTKSKPEETWQEKGKELWTFMHSYNIYEPGSVTGASSATWALTDGRCGNIGNGLKNMTC